MSCLPVTTSASFYSNANTTVVERISSYGPASFPQHSMPKTFTQKCSEEDLKYHQAMVNVRRQKASAEDLEIIKQWKNKKNPYR